MSERTPAITLYQPWAWAIVAGHKDIENRDWQTRYRGRLLIHAGKTYDVLAQRWIEDEADLAVPEAARQTGLVGEVTLLHIDDDPNEASVWAVPGMYHWLLTDPVAYDEPIPARGMPGLWWPK